MEAEMLKGLAIEATSFALVAWLVLQTFSKTIPTLTEQFRQDLQREREASERGLREVAEALERLSIILIYHDATCRGRNIETHGSTDELLRILRGKTVKGGSKDE
ncbi:MAG: hypothetical protein KF760_09350 [Candidatus Eremiobacteraeota bacterium]|nr:hypothetical protein [Candidatus Eremiobacteraeota bacterium]MCW5866029.1 hypothetical protein [Candidatus Eremiobacteraeota bacterium]